MSEIVNRFAKTDASVELMRCFAAMMVIAIHIMIPSVLDGQAIPTRVYASCLIGDAVGIFWMIAGFFMFSETKTYGKVVKRSIFGIMLPTLAMFIAVFFLFDWAAGTRTSTLVESLSHPIEDYMAFSEALLLWTAGTVKETNIAWYVFIYMMIVFTWPIWNSFVLRYLKGSNRNQLVFLAIVFVAFALNFATTNRTLEFTHHTIGGMLPAAMMVIAGYILYQHKDLFRSRKLYGVLAIALFLIVNAVRMFCQIGFLGIDGAPTGAAPTMWYNPFGLICAGCVVVACLSLAPSKPEGVFARTVCVLGDATLTIYLIHFAIKDIILARFGNVFEKILYTDGGYSVAGTWTIVNQSFTDMLYLLLTTLSIFIICFVIAWIMSAVWRGAKTLYGHIRNE